MPRPAALLIGCSLLAATGMGPLAVPPSLTASGASLGAPLAAITASDPEETSEVPAEGEGRSFAEPLDLVRAPAGRLPPRPHEVVPAAGVEEGELVSAPPVTWIPTAPGEDLQPELSLTNGTEHELQVRIASRSVVPHEDDGAPVAADERTGPAEWLELLQTEVGLRRAERAYIWPTITVPEGTEPGNHALAVVADARVVGRDGGRIAVGDETVRVESLLVVSVAEPDTGPAAPTGPQLELRNRPRSSLARLTLRTETDVTAVAGSLRLEGWFGAASTEAAIPPEVILPGTTRQVDIGFRPPLVPGRYTATAVLGTPDGGHLELRTSAWLWHPAVAAATALALIAAASIWHIRTRRSGRP
jgi:hypothetical protein